MILFTFSVCLIHDGILNMNQHFETIHQMLKAIMLSLVDRLFATHEVDGINIKLLFFILLLNFPETISLLVCLGSDCTVFFNR